MKKVYFLSLLTLFFIYSSIAFSQTSKPLAVKVSNVFIKINPGDTIAISKNFNNNELGMVYLYFHKAFQNSNSFYPDQIKQVIEGKLVNEGFNVTAWGGLFEETNEYEKPKLAFGAIIKDLKIYTNFNWSKFEIRNKINWQVLDLESNQVVYNKNISVTYFTNNPRIQTSVTSPYYHDFSVCIDSSIYASMDKLLSDPNFKNHLSIKSKQEALPLDTSLIKISKIALINTAGFYEKSVNGTVTIKTPSGFGSGFFINNKGLILTCQHVIKNHQSVDVFLKEGVSIKAKVIKANAEFDVALLQVEGINSTPLAIGTSTSCKIGNDVCVIGTPGSEKFSQSVSKGIISGQRAIEGKHYLQTDASVSPGNSGGPMINNKGEVVGIVNAKVVSYGTEGISFSIPIEVACEKLNIKIE